MTLLERLRRSPGWFVLLVGVTTLVVTTAALVPHDDGRDTNGTSCLLCHAGQTALQRQGAVLAPEPAPPRTIAVPEDNRIKTRLFATDTSSPRAPPA